MQQAWILFISGSLFNLLLFFIFYAGINEVRQTDIFRILSGILHMGNIRIEPEERSVDKCVVQV